MLHLFLQLQLLQDVQLLGPLLKHLAFFVVVTGLHILNQAPFVLEVFSLPLLLFVVERCLQYFSDGRVHFFVELVVTIELFHLWVKVLSQRLQVAVGLVRVQHLHQLTAFPTGNPTLL